MNGYEQQMENLLHQQCEEDVIVTEVWRRSKLIKKYLIEQCGQTVDDDRFASIYKWNHEIYLMQQQEEGKQ